MTTMLVACAVQMELSWLEPRPGVEVLVTGVGPVEAAASVSRRLATGAYGLVVNAGIAGAWPGVARIGDGVVVSHESIELDLETGEPIALPEGQSTRGSVESNAALVDALRRRDIRVVRGITVSRVTASDATAIRLQSLGAQIESMEGFAVLRAAQLADVPAIELRGISNLVGARERSSWNFAAGMTGLQNVMRVLFTIIAGTGVQ